jgi:hypothetical protein
MALLCTECLRRPYKSKFLRVVAFRLRGTGFSETRIPTLASQEIDKNLANKARKMSVCLLAHQINAPDRIALAGSTGRGMAGTRV